MGDMRNVRLGHRFKAVLIHDAISYLVSEAEIAATLDTARAHLEPGGVLVISPDWRETFPGTYISSEIKRREGDELGFVEYWYDADPEDTTLQGVYVYIFGRLRVHDFHVTGLFPLQTWPDEGCGLRGGEAPLSGPHGELGVLPAGLHSGFAQDVF